jgi:uncharacterized glyoxalase superfamily protein PhnB
MKITTLSPVLVVKAIEPCLPFWTERLGFTLEAKVAGDDDVLVFALLRNDGVRVMLQTRASMAEDLPQLETQHRQRSVCLYLNVPDIDAAERAFTGVKLAQDRRKTFYGAIEIGVHDPAGNLVLLGQHDH